MVQGSSHTPVASGPSGPAEPPGGAGELQGEKGTHLRHVYAPDVIPDLRGGQFPQAAGRSVLQGGPGNGPDGGGPKGEPGLRP